MTEAAHSAETRLPHAVRAQMERINAKLQEAKAPAPLSVSPPDPSIQEPAQAAPVAPAPSQAHASVSVGDPDNNDPAYLRQLAATFKGRLKLQEERHSTQLAERDRKIDELHEKIRTLEAKQRTEPSQLDVSLFFTREQIEHFGEDQCEAMARAAMTAAGQQAQSVIEAELKPIRERSEARDRQAVADKESEFWEKLAELAPNYPETNVKPEWLAWLAEVDEATGLVRQDILDRHRGALNATGVAKMFKAFDAASERPRPPVVPPRSAGGGAGGEAPAVPTKGYPSAVEIKDYYKRAAIGRVTDKERTEFEARLKSKHAA